MKQRTRILLRCLLLLILLAPFGCATNDGEQNYRILEEDPPMFEVERDPLM